MIGRSILITGCNRGLGLEFVKQLTRPGARSPSGAPLIATCRDPSSAHELQKLRSEDANLHILKLDTTDFAGLKAFAEDVKTLTDPSSGLGLLINNAGIGSGLTRFHTVTQELMEDVYRTNAVAPMMLTQALAEQLKMFGAHSEENSGEKALIVNMSSILGSLANNPYATGKGGGIYQYRTSKAALNMLTRCFAVDLARYGVHCISMHPGWVSTDMGGPNAPVTPHQSVQGMLKVIREISPKDNGEFFDFEGKKVPW